MPDFHIEQYFMMLAWPGRICKTACKRIAAAADRPMTKELEKQLQEKQNRINGQAAQIKILNEKLEKSGGGSADSDKINQLERMITPLQAYKASGSK